MVALIALLGYLVAAIARLRRPIRHLDTRLRDLEGAANQPRQ